MNKLNYAEIAKEAQDAVEAIKDPELKRVAFEKILDNLLANGFPVKISEPNLHKKNSKHKIGTKPKASKIGPSGQIKALAEEGYFKTPKGISKIKDELAARGFHLTLALLATPLRRLCQQKILRRSKEAGGNGYTYSNW